MLDEPVWDGIGTAAIGVLLIAVAIVLIIETKSLLLGEAASPAAVARIEAALVGDPASGITGVIHHRTMHLGPDEVLVAAKVAMPPSSSLAEVASAINAAEARVRAAEPAARVIYLEPDVYQPELAGGASAAARPATEGVEPAAGGAG
jgi:divalent metal cation (Fe/Co/Zn/Cd) transporter